MARYDHLPIRKDATSLTVLLEEAWCFRHYHKYALDTDLRRQAHGVWRDVAVANAEREERARMLDRVIVAVEKLELLVRMRKQVRTVASFKGFGCGTGCCPLETEQGWRRLFTGEGASVSRSLPSATARRCAPAKIRAHTRIEARHAS